MKIFGREPALVVGFVGAVLTALVAAGVPGLNAGQAAAIMALLVGAITAWATRPMAPGLYAGLVGAGAAVLAEYKFEFSEQVTASLTGLVLASFALFAVRDQVTPVRDAVPISPADGKIR